MCSDRLWLSPLQAKYIMASSIVKLSLKKSRTGKRTSRPVKVPDNTSTGSLVELFRLTPDSMRNTNSLFSRLLESKVLSHTSPEIDKGTWTNPPASTLISLR